MRKLFFYILCIGCAFSQIKAQHKFELPDKNDLSSIYYSNPNRNGFMLSASLVAMFTSGTADRNGFRIGIGLGVSYTVDNWSFSAGTDVYKAQEKFGPGTSYIGCSFFDGQYGGSYFVNRYYQGEQQTSAILGAQIDDFQLRFEDDILALPFTGFKIHDRYRTAALELQYKGVLLGTNVYTTDINGVTDISTSNSKGEYMNGKQISSPIYIGYTKSNLIVRYGLNNHLGGLWGQNGWHRKFFGTPDFIKGDYNNQFIQLGVNKRYTLY